MYIISTSYNKQIKQNKKDKRNLRRGLICPSVRIKSILVGKSQRPKLEAAAQVASLVRKQRER